MMKFDVLTLFPEMLDRAFEESIIGRARVNGIIEINCVNIRDFSNDKHNRVDDSPYGGGFGMVMRPEPVYNACKSLQGKPFVVYMSPQGKVFSQEMARELAQIQHIAVLCGHYEGIDERVLEEVVDLEVSIGDYVLTGGEIPAMVLVDAVSRLIPGVLPSEEVYSSDSHYNGILEHSQYTRPSEFMGKSVPEVLLSGNHANISKWKHEKSLEITREKRPDLYEQYTRKHGQKGE